MDLVDKLQERMGDATQLAFAAFLDIPQPTLSRILARDARVGPHIARKILARYPDLAFDAASYLLSESENANVAQMRS